MSSLTVSPEYRTLLRKFPPRVIRTKEENEAYTEVLCHLDRHSNKLTAAEKEFAELFTLLIEGFEEKHYHLPRASPVGALRFLTSTGSSRRTSWMCSGHRALCQRS